MSKGNYTAEFPGIDDPEQKPMLKNVFTRGFVSVVTRCFGWGLPKTSMIPFADCINHHNVDSTYELIHTEYHYYANESSEHPLRRPKAYFSPSKIEGDYSDFLDYEDQYDELIDGTRKKKTPRPYGNRTVN